ncbi:hypothetical protein FUT48_00330 [Pseudomonas sp. JG-B]|nr:hypothetical protein [Pseudomonas sp. JG-B]
MEQQTVNPEVRARIVAAIEQLYEELGRGDAYPTAAAVRARAKANMNDASAVLREWKKQQTAKPTPVATSVPELVMQACVDAAAIIWGSAQEEANASLRDAEQKWSREIADQETMRRELAEAYEGVMSDLERARQELGEAVRGRDQLSQQNQTLIQQLAEAREALAQQTARANETERRAEDLKEELGRAHDEITDVRRELREARESHLQEKEQLQSVATEQIDRAKTELAEVRGRSAANAEQQAQVIERLQAQTVELQGALARAEASAEMLQEQRKRSAEEAHILRRNDSPASRPN